MTSAIFAKPSVEYIRGLTLWYQASGSEHQCLFDESRICNSTSLYYTQTTEAPHRRSFSAELSGVASELAGE